MPLVGNGNDKYKIIFYLFHLCFISKSSRMRCPKSIETFSLWKVFNIALNLIIYAFEVTVVIFFCLNQDGARGKKGVYIFLNTTCILFRIYLCESLKELKFFSKNILRVPYFQRNRKKLPLWILIWMCSSLCIFFVLSVYMFKSSTKPEEYTDLSVLNHKLYVIPIIIHTVFQFIFLFLPFYIFSFYYAVICSDIQSIIYDFQLLMASYPREDYNKLNRIYCEIKLLISRIDSRIGFLVLLSFSLNGFLLHTGFLILLKGETDGYVGETIAASVCCGGSFANFIAMAISASSVNDAARSVKLQSEMLQEDNPNFVCPYIRFLQNCGHEISMTVWGIVNIKRNFAFGMIGTILTYSVLIDGMM